MSPGVASRCAVPASRVTYRETSSTRPRLPTQDLLVDISSFQLADCCRVRSPRASPTPRYCSPRGGPPPSIVTVRVDHVAGAGLCVYPTGGGSGMSVTASSPREVPCKCAVDTPWTSAMDWVLRPPSGEHHVRCLLRLIGGLLFASGLNVARAVRPPDPSAAAVHPASPPPPQAFRRRAHVSSSRRPKCTRWSSRRCGGSGTSCHKYPRASDSSLPSPLLAAVLP